MKSLILKEKLRRLVETVVLGAAMLALLLWSGWQILGTTGLIAFGIGGVLMFLVLSRRSPSLALAQGVPVRYMDAPELYQTLQAISRKAGLASTPRLYLLPTPMMNALTIGTQEDSAILITQGLIARLTLRELAGVLAHEVSHLRNNDIWVFSFANYLRQATAFVSRFGWILLLLAFPVLFFSGTTISLGAVFALMAAPVLSYLLQLALLRSREFSADVGAVELTGDPDGLAAALTAIQMPQRSVFDLLFPMRRTDSGHSLFRTHPATEERIRRLRELARAGNAKRRGSNYGDQGRADYSDDDAHLRSGSRRSEGSIYFDTLPEDAPEWFRRR